MSIRKSCTMNKKNQQKTTRPFIIINPKNQHDFLLAIIIIVFPYLTPTDNTAITGRSIPKESKALIFSLNKLGTETKLQSFNFNNILKDFGILHKGWRIGMNYHSLKNHDIFQTKTS